MSQRFPSRIVLRVQPDNLRAAVGKLGYRLGLPGASRQELAALRRLLQGESPQLSTKQLRLLPALVIEYPDTGDRVARTAIRDLPRLRWSLVASLLAYLPGQEALVSACRARATLQPPRRGPGWLLELSELAPGPLDDALMWHLRMRPLEELLDPRGLGLSPETPLGDAVLCKRVGSLSREELEGDYVLLLELVEESRGSVQLRRLVLVGLFHVHMNAVTRPADLAERPQLVRTLVAAHGWAGGWPTRASAMWKDLPEPSRRWAMWHLLHREIEAFFDRSGGNEERKSYWKAWVSRMTDYELFEEAGVFVMHLKDYRVVEFLHHGNACYIYHSRRWEDLRPARGTSSESAFKHRDAATRRLTHRGEWVPRFTAELRNLGLRL